MDNDDIRNVEQKTEDSKQQAMKEAHTNRTEQKGDGDTIHTINPFTGTEITITPEDIDGIEKKREADTERD